VRAVVQRVSRASVSVDGATRGEIDGGLLVLLGVAADDDERDALWLAGKTAGLRIFDDADGRMNLSVAEAAAARGGRARALVVSQFTLMGDARKGRRPSWEAAAAPEKARALYGLFVDGLRDLGVLCETGEFRARMTVESANEGPVTILLDSADARGGAQSAAASAGA